MDKKNQGTIALFKIFTENAQMRYGYQNNYLLTDLFKILYPEKSYSASKIRSYWKEHLRKINKNNIINFYIHIPYCISKCSYCICSSSPITGLIELSDYLNNLHRSLQYFKETFSKTVFNNLYIGGGTPSILSEKQLDFLFNSIFHNFRFNNNAEKTMELNPASTNLEKLNILKKHGFNRVSFGVQSLDDVILSRNNRGYQSYQAVKSAILNAKIAGFKDINTDLILGLFGDTREKFIESFKKLAALKPATISVYPLQPKTDYIEKYFKSHINLFYDFYKNLVKETIVSAKPLAKKNGYTFPEISLKNISTATSWPFFSKDVYPLIFKDTCPLKSRYSFDNRYNSSIFALGFEGVSYIYNKIRYYNLCLTKYPENNICDGVIFNKRMEMTHYILRTLSLKKCISRKEFTANFSADLLTEFRDAFKNLKGKLFVDTLDTDKVYFRPYLPKERFLNSIFFFKKELIIERMNDFLADNLICLIINGKEFTYRIQYSKKISGSALNKLYSFIPLNNYKKLDKITKKALNAFERIFSMICVKYNGSTAEIIRNAMYEHILTNSKIIKNKIGINSIYISKL